jgi:uncharacterized membrane protein (UPF0127 family)
MAPRRARSAIGFAVAAAVLVAACGSDGSPTGLTLESDPARAPFPGLTETQLAVGDDCLELVVADADDERIVGLTGRSDLGPYDGMLFVFDGDSTATFTMSGVPVPLSIGWYDRDGRPAGREEMVPCEDARADCPSYAADDPYRYAVETLDGGLAGGALGACPS